MIRSGFILLVLLTIVSSATAQFPIPTPPPGFPTDALTPPSKAKAKKGQFIFKLSSKARATIEANIKAQHGQFTQNLFIKEVQKTFGLRDTVSVKGSSLWIAKKVRGKKKRKFKKALRKLGAKAEKNYKRFAFSSNDFFLQFGLLWNLSNSGFFGGGDTDVDAPEAWELTQGKQDLVVGIIDTGILTTHPDLQANIYVNPKEKPNGIDDDGNGFIDDISGWDFFNNDNDATDDHFHGSHVAGIVAAERNNGRGIAGVAPNVKLLPLKVLSGKGEGDTAGLIRAVEYVNNLRKQGVNIRVMNASLGGGEPLQAMREALRESNKLGITFVAAAGNSTEDNDSKPTYPASYKLSNVISVAATSPSGELASFSNFGARSVHVAAPGESIWSTIIFNFYLPASGTSQAAPHVAGVAALLHSKYPNWSPSRVKDRIMNSVKPIDSLKGVVQSPGVVSAFKALR